MKLFWPSAIGQPELAHDEAHIWAVPLDDCHAENELWAALSPDERQRAERFRFDHLRRRFVAGRAALRMLLAAYLDTPPPSIQFAYDANGKPWLPSPHDQATLRFNLAHSEDLALVAVLRDCEVGIDLERMRTVADLERIAERYFHDAEKRAVFATAAEMREVAFFHCWTAKEAVLKAIGTGLSGSLSSFQVPDSPHDGDWIHVPAPSSSAAARCWLEQLAPCDSFVAAVAFVGERRRIRCFAHAW